MPTYKRRLLLALGAFAFFAVSLKLLLVADGEYNFLPRKRIGIDELSEAGLKPFYEATDDHPISRLMVEADKRWTDYNKDRSRTFKETISKYRKKYGRHPPPGFDVWYLHARKLGVWNIDDFQQIMDDLRPFWAVEPSVIRSLAAHMWENLDHGISSIHVRNHRVAKQNNQGWRSETMAIMVDKLAKYLPDMDIAMNRLDQPRVAVPWNDLQKHLATELETRQLPPDATNEFTQNQPGLLDLDIKPEDDKSPRTDPEWFYGYGARFMEIAKDACPPESHANNEAAVGKAEALYKDPVGGVIKNFNLSTDLCTVGPEVKDKHGFLFIASSMIPTRRLVPVFGECKVNVNNDILFPANMYMMHDERYEYNGENDVPWEEKEDSTLWRGVTSGGVNVPDSWRRLHRHRLVLMMNATEMEKQEARVVTETLGSGALYANLRSFKPSSFLANHSDVGFTEAVGCHPNCSALYDGILSYKPQIPLTQQFTTKYLLDVDGHSFSGRWRAFLQSKSLGIKATIFREWHDSRLFEWRHFVPMDNRYDDVYTILTYFMGNKDSEQKVNIARHDMEAKRIALQGREWANKVLRQEDIEIYMFRLLLEYARIIDDNRDHIGYSGDGSELEEPPAVQ